MQISSTRCTVFKVSYLICFRHHFVVNSGLVHLLLCHLLGRMMSDVNQLCQSWIYFKVSSTKKRKVTKKLFKKKLT